MLLYEHNLMKLSYVDKLFDPQNGLWTTYNKENKGFSKNDNKTVWIKSREHLHVERPLFLPKTG